MIHKPTRRDILKYAGVGGLANKLSGQMIPFPGPGVRRGGGSPPIPPLISSTYVAGNGNQTTSPIDTTTATLLLFGVISYGSSISTAGFTDSQGNTWSVLPRAAIDPSNTAIAKLFYCFTPTTSATHTASFVAGSGYYQVIFFAAFNGPVINYLATYTGVTSYSIGDVVVTSGTPDFYMSKTNANMGNDPTTSPANWSLMQTQAGNILSSTLQPGAVVPVNNNSFLACIVADATTGSSHSMDSGFHPITTIAGTATYIGGGLWFQQQSIAASINPTVTVSGGNTPQPITMLQVFLND